MEYMKIVEKSFSNAWRYKFLWLFGFFVSVADGFGGGHWWTNKLDRYDNWHRFRDFGCFDIEPMFIIMFVLAAFAIWFLFWVMAVLSEGALIHGISRKELNQEVSFRNCWSAGFGKFFRLFGIMLVAIAAVLLLLVGFLIVIVPSYFASTALGVLLTLFAVPLFFAIILLVICVEGWAIRFGMLYDDSWLTSIEKGWTLFKKNTGKTLGVAFSSFLAQLIAWVVLLLCTLILAIPFVGIGFYDLWLGLIPGIMVLFVIIVLSSAVFGTFASSVWTIGFMKLTGYDKGETDTKTSEAP